MVYLCAHKCDWFGDEKNGRNRILTSAFIKRNCRNPNTKLSSISDCNNRWKPKQMTDTKICFLAILIQIFFNIYSIFLTLQQSMLSRSRVQGLIYGLKVTVLYLGGFKVAIVMWIYGIQRFVTDIQFWLGFKPTKFWIVCWMFLPIVLFVSLVVLWYLLFLNSLGLHN